MDSNLRLCPYILLSPHHHTLALWALPHLCLHKCSIHGAYRDASHPHFGHLDHISLFLYPAYRQRRKQTNPVTKQVKLYTPYTDPTGSWRTVLLGQNGMCLKLQPLWRSLLSAYRTVLSMWLDILAHKSQEALDKQPGMSHAACPLSCI